LSGSPEQLTAFERQVIGLIVEGTSQGARILQEQLAVATVEHRGSGSGSGTTLEVPDYAARLPGRAEHRIANLGGIVTDRDGREITAYFILHVSDGCIRMLEGVCADAPWPIHPQLGRWWYHQRGRDGLIL
jgi:hypothetical protein